MALGLHFLVCMQMSSNLFSRNITSVMFSQCDSLSLSSKMSYMAGRLVVPWLPHARYVDAFLANAKLKSNVIIAKTKSS